MSDRIIIIDYCDRCPCFAVDILDGNRVKCERDCEIKEDDGGLYEIPEECPLNKIDDYLVLKTTDLDELINKGKNT